MQVSDVSVKKTLSSAPVTALTATATATATVAAAKEAVGRDMKSEESIDEVSLTFYESQLLDNTVTCLHVIHL